MKTRLLIVLMVVVQVVDAQRRYTVREIDELRVACETRWLYGTTYLGFDGQGGWSRQYKQEERDRGVEELVRTYMLAGVTAKMIYEEDKRKARERASIRDSAKVSIKIYTRKMKKWEVKP